MTGPGRPDTGPARVDEWAGDGQEADWAAPERAVRARAREHVETGEPAVLATVVDVEGRAYRRPGARAVVASGGAAGAVTAGCLTDHLRSLAAEVVDDGEPRLVRFDLREDEGTWGLGVGCDGVVEVLLEPLGEHHRPLVDPGAPVTAAVVVESDDGRLAVGDRAVVTAEDGASGEESAGGGGSEDAARETGDGESTDGVDGVDSGESADPVTVDAWPAAVADAVPERPDAAQSVTVDTDRGRVRVFVERVTPPPRLLVVGSGPDARPVVELGRQADFEVTVAGFRGGHATAERFPGADRVVATSPRDLTDAVTVDADTYAVVMTHNAVDDQLAVEALLDSPAPYVGVMGSDDRVDRLLDAVADDRDSDTADRDRVYGPVGLDVGAGTPYQVAHSIVGEVLAVANDRAGGHLRDETGPIHDRPSE